MMKPALAVYDVMRRMTCPLITINTGTSKKNVFDYMSITRLFTNKRKHILSPTPPILWMTLFWKHGNWFPTCVYAEEGVIIFT